MAQSQTFVNTGSQGSLREDLANFISRVSWEKTKFLTLCGKKLATAVTHSWTTEALADAAANEQLSGFTVTFAAGDANLRTKVTNQVQILMKKVSADKSIEWVDKAGLGQASEYDHQVQIKTKELALDLDRALLRSTVVTRADDTQTAGVMRGMIQALATNVVELKDQSGLSTDPYFRLCQIIDDAGGDPDIAMMSGANRLIMDSWSAGQRQWNMRDTELAMDVEIIRSGFSKQAVVHNKHMTATDVILFQQNMNNVAYGRGIRHEELKPDADRRGGYVVTEATLEYKNELSGGKISGIKS